MASLPPSKKARKSKRKTATAEDEVLIDDEAPVVTGPKNARYAESSRLAVHAGTELGQDNEDGAADADGTLDANLAELSLGQRLSAISSHPAADGDSDSDTGHAPSSRRQQPAAIVPAHSLTRTLIQALHSSDARLLETCLAHSEPALIRNTVRRLPPQLAVPLLTACMARLARGGRAANIKGRGAAASAQRGTGLIAWVKAVLVVHSGHLMTIPDLVSQLAQLHSTLTARLAIQDSLLALGGRLDMVLSQIEMRSSVAPAPLVPHSEKDKRDPAVKQPRRYVEGESEEEDGDEGMDVEVESADAAGSIEDIELGGESESEEESDEDGSRDEDDDDSDGDGPTLNGFIDDEAEEFDEDEDDDESE
ncbi:hypothetical protein BJ138DRAFT_1097259 [Hygrophoropsis aurantiaca]|uniref:Uncharacterized protein n=1 Tax=Hygrophoropsis aurantiaca TaxID=72124 RepID=A0ACB8ASY0_9AGAM|nr:hypothetical protein BJ138DRAFT_1097259 [Hygrophoropsis aurantiaca]